MHPSAFACLALLISFLSIASANLPTYGWLAAEIGPSLFERALQQNGSLAFSTAPPDSALGSFRKALIDARDVLDIFAYAYPLPSHDKNGKNLAQDVWVRARDDIDKGYTAIGDFQDLGHVNCPPGVLTAMRNTCIEWRDAFVANVQRFNYAALFEGADVSSELFVRPLSELSDKYWRICKHQPSASLTGVHNLALLLSGMIDQLILQLPTLQSLTEMYEETQVDTLHDYKKQLRALRTVYTWYPTLWNVTSEESRILLNFVLANVSAVYKALDTVHSLGLRPVFYTKTGTPLEYRASALIAQNAWHQLNNMLTEISWKEQLYLLQALIITTDPSPKAFEAKSTLLHILQAQ